MRMKLVICTTDENYASRFVDYFNVHYGDKIELSQFTDLTYLAQFIRNERPDMCLVDEYMLDQCEVDMFGNCSYILLGNQREHQHEEVPCIFKYQKAELIYKEILNYYADKKGGRRTTGVVDGNAAKTYAFCSPSGGCGATTVALAYAANLAKTKRVLYLGFQQYGNADTVLNGEGNGSFDDVIFALSNKRGDLRLKMESIVRTSKEKIDFFKSCENPMDLQELTKDDLARLINEVVHGGMYQVVVFDIDSQIGMLELEILKVVDQIVVVTEGNDGCAMKFDKFYTLLNVIQSKEDVDLIDKLGLFYNKFSNKASEAISGYSVPVIGGMAKFEGVQMPGIVGRMSGMDCFKDFN